MMFINAMLYALFGICIYSSAINNMVDCLCDITSGTSNAVRIGENTSCTHVLQTASGLHAQYLWNTEEISCIDFDVVSNKVEGNVINIITEEVSCGPFDNLLFTRTDTFPDFSLGCLDEGGVTQITGVGIGTIGIWPMVCYENITYSPRHSNDFKLTNVTFTRVCTIVAAIC